MSLVGSQHKERYESMRADVNKREIEWWLFRYAGSGEISEDLKFVMSILKEELMVVGPFGQQFVKDNKDTFKRDFYGIPLQHSFVGEHIDGFEGLSYVGANDQSAVLCRSIFDYLRDPANQAAFEHLNLTAICVQSKYMNNNTRTVVSIDCIEKLQPFAFYEHPANGRLLEALQGNYEPPEQNALALYGKRKVSKIPLHLALADVNSSYQEYELENLSTEGLALKLYSHYLG